MVLVDFWVSQFSKNCYQELPLKSRNSYATEPGSMTFVAKTDYKSKSKPVLSILGNSSSGQIGTPGHRAPITEHCTIKVLMKNDLWSLGIIFMVKYHKIGIVAINFRKNYWKLSHQDSPKFWKIRRVSTASTYQFPK